MFLDGIQVPHAVVDAMDEQDHSLIASKSGSGSRMRPQHSIGVAEHAKTKGLNPVQPFRDR
jgi:hypothetical protein